MDQEALKALTAVRTKKNTAWRSRWRKKLIATPLVLVCAPGGCSKKPPDDPPPPVIVSATATVPPVAFSGVPVSDFADAAVIDGKTPYEQARAFEEKGQLWMARLVLEKKALGPDGTKAEAELLAHICHEQGDETCIEECGKKLGRKLKFDGGVSVRPKFDAGEHKEPDSELAKARDHVLKHRLKEAREILEPKVIEGKASKEEIRLLQTVCKQQSDRMCVALCDAKLK